MSWRPEASRIAAAAGADARFVQADVYVAVRVLGAGSFDLVFTGVGALTWLPDIRRWGRVVADPLRPGGRLFIRDGHPMMLALDVDGDGRLVVADSYFETAEAKVSDYAGTYVQTKAAIGHTVTHWWNHGIGQTVTALLEAGLTLTCLAEHDTVPWRASSPGNDGTRGQWRVAAGRTARTAHRQLHHPGRQELVTSRDASPKTESSGALGGPAVRARRRCSG